MYAVLYVFMFFIFMIFCRALNCIRKNKTRINFLGEGSRISIIIIDITIFYWARFYSKGVVAVEHFLNTFSHEIIRK